MANTSSNIAVNDSNLNSYPIFSRQWLYDNWQFSVRSSYIIRMIIVITMILMMMFTQNTMIHPTFNTRYVYRNILRGNAHWALPNAYSCSIYPGHPWRWSMRHVENGLRRIINPVIILSYLPMKKLFLDFFLIIFNIFTLFTLFWVGLVGQEM